MSALEQKLRNDIVELQRQIIEKDKKLNMNNKPKFSKGAAMWTKRFRSNLPDHAKQEYYFSIRLEDGTWINMRRNPAKMIGDNRPEFIQFEPEDLQKPYISK